jgi:site-specific recombinase XerD
MFIRWLAENEVTALGDISSHTIKRYLIHLQDKGLTDHSQHDYARAAKTFLGYCVRDELLPKSPWANVRMPKLADSLPVILSDDEIQTALQKVKDHRNRLIIRFILDSGVRAAELLALNVGDIDMATGLVTVKMGKQQKGRLTSIGAATRKAVKHYLLLRKSPPAAEPLIASLRKPVRLKMVGLMHAFRKMQQQTGIDHLTAHTLRRTMATKSLENGMDAYILSQMLGHADMQMMRRYAAMNRETIQAASEKCSVVDNLE